MENKVKFSGLSSNLKTCFKLFINICIEKPRVCGVFDQNLVNFLVERTDLGLAQQFVDANLATCFLVHLFDDDCTVEAITTIS